METSTFLKCYCCVWWLFNTVLQQMFVASSETCFVHQYNFSFWYRKSCQYMIYFQEHSVEAEIGDKFSYWCSQVTAVRRQGLNTHLYVYWRVKCKRLFRLRVTAFLDVEIAAVSVFSNAIFILLIFFASSRRDWACVSVDLPASFAV